MLTDKKKRDLHFGLLALEDESMIRLNIARNTYSPEQKIYAKAWLNLNANQRNALERRLDRRYDRVAAIAATAAAIAAIISVITTIYMSIGKAGH